MDFSRSHEGKEENPRNYHGLRASERKNTFHFTLNQRQLLSFGTVYDVFFTFSIESPEFKTVYISATDITVTKKLRHL
jgi:hypothetical protein